MWTISQVINRRQKRKRRLGVFPIERPMRSGQPPEYRKDTSLLPQASAQRLGTRTLPTSWRIGNTDR